MADTYTVDGMTCGGCARSVTNAITKLAPDARVSVDLPARAVTVDGATESTVRQAVEAAGFEFLGRAA